MATSISINTSDTEYGTKKQKSVSYIDPNATNQELIAFAQGMVSLMADTSYESTTRIERTECDNDTRATYPTTRMDYVKMVNGSQTFPTFTIESPVINMTTDNFPTTKTLTMRITTSYISMPETSCSSTNWTFAGAQYSFTTAGGSQTNVWTVRVGTSQETIQAETSTINLHFDGTNEYKPFDLEIQFNITQAGE